MVERCGVCYTKQNLFEPIPQKNRAKLLQKSDMTKFFLLFFEKKAFLPTKSQKSEPKPGEMVVIQAN